MKVLLFLVIIISSINYSQWVIQNPIPPHTFNSVHCVDSVNAWVAGNNGIIMRTSDGGTNWFNLESGVNSHLRKIRFADLNNGWAVGDSGKIIRTTNGGNSWVLQNFTPGLTLTLLSVINNQHVYASGYWGLNNQFILLYSSNAGTSWATLNMRFTVANENVSDMVFIDQNKGWYCTSWYVSPFTGGAIYGTNNGGLDWTKQRGADMQLSIDFHNETIGWSVGYQQLFKTTTGGLNWYPLGTHTGKFYSHIYFSDAQTGWLVEMRTGYNDHIFFSSSGGTSWTEQYSSNGRRILDLSFANNLTGWAVGQQNLLLKTSNGGESWESQFETITLPSNALYDVHFANPDTGIALGYWGILLKTTDGGKNWINKSVDSSNWFNSVYFVDSKTGWAAATGKILKTTDYGDSWQTQISGNYGWLYSVHFTDSLNGWVVGANGSIFNTNNGGIDWLIRTDITSESIQSIHFLDHDNAWMVGGYGTILKSTDAGITWENKPSGTSKWLYSVYFINPLTGWVIGSAGTILKTTDGGETWVNQYDTSTHKLLSVFFTDSNHGWVVGSYGLILKTTDGGANWESESSNTTSSLESIYFVNSTTGWIVGNGSTILKTTDGGVTFIEVEENGFNSPGNFALHQNYPNPFNPSTKISWQSPVGSWQVLKVFDVLGREVAILVDEYKEAGYHEVEFQSSVGSRQLASGIYYYQLKAESFIETKKMIFIQ